MFLLLDAGNTRVKWAIVEAGQWIADGALTHDAIGELARIATAHGAISRVVGANVAGERIAGAIAEALASHAPGPEWLQATRQQCGVHNSYDSPSQLGADRWAALIGARAIHPGDCLVVMAGTATTIDTLGADGQFRGGVILPGLALMRESLSRNTAQLPLAEGQFSDWPRCTADAIVSGCLAAQTGAIERLFGRIAEHPDARCLLSGGTAETLEMHLGIPFTRIENLVLKGLAVIAGVPPAAIAANSGAIR